ncbi:MAG: DegV family protein [Oscillospiraceae bacterium]|nr:DegV family protein [Oscillospiraceae bacterium]
MSKIKLITDSASDIDHETAVKNDIHVIGFSVSLGQKSYIDGTDFTTDEFYRMLDSSNDFPKTAQITPMQFVDIYKDYYEKGYTHLIYVSISSTGSATINNAKHAIDMFFDDVPDARDKIKISVVDSLNYTACYGYPLITAASKIKKGQTAEEILAYLDDWFSSVEMYFVPYTLEYVKRSGRLSAAAAFVGELLGLKPVIKMVDGVSYVPEKIRGEKNIIPKIIEIAKKNMVPRTPYILLSGSLPDESAQLEKEITKALGYAPEYNQKIGPTISSHAGHKVVGIILKGSKRR